MNLHSSECIFFILFRINFTYIDIPMSLQDKFDVLNKAYPGFAALKLRYRTLHLKLKRASLGLFLNRFY